MKFKNGFTLIELLAVILILGIIALIAIPTVNKILDEARKGAFEATLNNIEKKVNDNCSMEQLKGKVITTSYTITNGIITPSLDIKGDLPDGNINVDKSCNVAYSLSNNTYTGTKTTTDEVVNITKGKNIVKLLKNDVAKVWTLPAGKTKLSELVVGDVLTLGTEKFNFISNKNNIIRVFSQYNLNVGGNKKTDSTEGIQNNEVLGYKSGSTTYGTVAFSNSKYWTKNDGELIELENSDNIINPYLKNYKTKLESLGAKISSVDLITRDELVALGCDIDTDTCSSAKDFVRNSSYWTNTSNNNDYAWVVFANGNFGGNSYGRNDSFGIRPVINIDIEDM